MTDLLLQRLPSRCIPLERIPRGLLRVSQRRPCTGRMIVRAAAGAVAFLDVRDTGCFDLAWHVGIHPRELYGGECWEDGRLLAEALGWRQGLGVQMVEDEELGGKGEIEIVPATPPPTRILRLWTW